jgi:MtN3 and saliva related transmembrane protein
LASTLVETIGFAAAATSTLCWFPQSLRTLRTRDTAGISLVSQAAFTGGVLLWASYGVMIGSLPLILCNTIQLVPLAAILWIKVGNERAARRAIP